MTVPAILRLVGADPGRSRRRWLVAWCRRPADRPRPQTLPHLRTRDLDAVLAPSAVAREVADRAGPLDRVLDRNIPGHQSSTPLGPAVAGRLGLATVRGYNPLDLVRFKEYLALVSDPVPVRNPYNGLINAYIKHKSLLDLLGVRFLVQPADPALRSLPGEPDPDVDPSWRRVGLDPSPSAFTFAAGGVRRLPPYEVLENRDAFPRAFVVPRVERLPPHRPGIVRAMTTTDFRRVALVESPGPLDVGMEPGSSATAPVRLPSPQPRRGRGRRPRPARPRRPRLPRLARDCRRRARADRPGRLPVPRRPAARRPPLRRLCLPAAVLSRGPGREPRDVGWSLPHHRNRPDQAEEEAGQAGRPLGGWRA